MPLSNSEALRAFAIKCKLDRSPAAMVAHGPINIFTLRMTDLLGVSFRRGAARSAVCLSAHGQLGRSPLELTVGVCLSAHGQLGRSPLERNVGGAARRGGRAVGRLTTVGRLTFGGGSPATSLPTRRRGVTRHVTAYARGGGLHHGADHST